MVIQKLVNILLYTFFTRNVVIITKQDVVHFLKFILLLVNSELIKHSWKRSDTLPQTEFSIASPDNPQLCLLPYQQ